MLFDAIFGQGKAVYETGGYLGLGQVVWLLARINAPREIGRGDVVQPYALFTNSHDGSVAFHIRLTTIRVVCENTLTMALNEKDLGAHFRRRRRNLPEGPRRRPHRLGGGDNRRRGDHREQAHSFYPQTRSSFPRPWPLRS